MPILLHAVEKFDECNIISYCTYGMPKCGKRKSGITIICHVTLQNVTFMLCDTTKGYRHVM